MASILQALDRQTKLQVVSEVHISRIEDQESRTAEASSTSIRDWSKMPKALIVHYSDTLQTDCGALQTTNADARKTPGGLLELHGRAYMYSMAER